MPKRLILACGLLLCLAAIVVLAIVFTSSRAVDRRIAIATDVTGAPSAMSLGFNNAEQVVARDNGSLLVAIVDDDVVVMTRNAVGDVTATQTIATGNVDLPAISISGETVAVGWTEVSGRNMSVRVALSFDGAVRFDDAMTLGTGNGLSLAATQGKIFAAWHEGIEKRGSTKIMLRVFQDGEWTAAQRVDASTAAPVWAAIDAFDEKVTVVWRDNREGDYTVWLRRSDDAGVTWRDEQQLVELKSGDPDVCITDDDHVWVAHHGTGDVTLLHSQDGGATFESRAIGDGWFAHLSCTDDAVAVAWEETSGPAQSEDKQPGWALVDDSGDVLDAGVIEEPNSASVTAYLSPKNTLELLWVAVTAAPDAPLVGELRHIIF